MPPKRLSKVEDWHERLIQAAMARHTQAVRNSNRDANSWKDAVSYLEKSKQKIYIAKSGLNKDLVVGIPPRIAPSIVQKLTRIVKEEEAVLLPEHEGRVSVDITDEQVVHGRNYRDSAFSILAALWLEYQGPGINPQHTSIVKRRAQKYTDSEMDFDFRIRKQGAWKAKDQLRRLHLINEENQNGGKVYSLTLIGAKACYYIFNEMFHPSKGDYELITPRRGQVDQHGNFTSYHRRDNENNSWTPTSNLRYKVTTL